MIRFPLKDKPRKLKGVLIGPGSGPQERIDYLKKMVTSLIRHERIEGRSDRMQETRQYAEQLINLAIQHGDKHAATMKMADEWLLEKDLVHKLFKVLAPRYQNYSTAFTSVYTLPATYPGSSRFNAVLELKGNPYPPVIPKQRETKYLLTNILLSAAGRDFYAEQKRQRSGDTSDQIESVNTEHFNQAVDPSTEIAKENINDQDKHEKSAEAEIPNISR